jgi:hypothetical protein
LSTAASRRPAAARYGLILTRRDIDRLGHDDLFTVELLAAFANAGQPMHCVDYMADPKRVLAAFMDPACRFFLCFNGFGAELLFPHGNPGRLTSAFEVSRHPIIDLMHDCPGHESMEHQLSATYPQRQLIITDYGYASMAQRLGFPNVRFMPSITFPTAFGSEPKALRDRDIEVLLPIGLAAPEFASRRHHEGGDLKSRVYRDIFYAVTEAAVTDLRCDPIAELSRASHSLDIELDFRRVDDRFLLSTILDFLKSERQRRLLRAVSGLPITVIGDREPRNLPTDSRLRFMPSCSAIDLLLTMGNARCVLCPNPHMTGYHARSLSAFTAGAAVISSPNVVLETNFVHRSDILFYRTEAEVAELIGGLLSQPEQMEDIALCGRKRALGSYEPARLIDVVLSLLDLHREGTPQC